MSGTIISSGTTGSTSLLTATEAAAKAANTTNKASGAAATGGSSDALASLTSNYNQFLSLLTAQLQHQDPTSPMDTDSFTSELAQFAGVEQQINTNTNLTQLLALNQDTQVSQGTALVGRQAVADTTEVPLQNGSAELQLNPTSPGAAEIAITNSAGTVVKTQALTLPAGTTDWSWNGQDDAGNQLPDGTYTAAVMSADGTGNTSSVPFNVIGTITGVSKDGTTGVNVQMGSTTVEMTKVTSLLGSAGSGSTGSGSTGSGTTTS